MSLNSDLIKKLGFRKSDFQIESKEEIIILYDWYDLYGRKHYQFNGVQINLVFSVKKEFRIVCSGTSDKGIVYSGMEERVESILDLKNKWKKITGFELHELTSK